MISERDWDFIDLEATETFIQWEEDFMNDFLADRKDVTDGDDQNELEGGGSYS